MGDVKGEEEAVDPGGYLCPLQLIPNELFLNIYKVGSREEMFFLMDITQSRIWGSIGIRP